MDDLLSVSCRLRAVGDELRALADAMGHVASDGARAAARAECEPPESYLRPGYVAELLGISETKVRYLIDRGGLPSIRVGDGSIRVPRSGYDRYCAGSAADRRRELGLD